MQSVLKDRALPLGNCTGSHHPKLGCTQALQHPHIVQVVEAWASWSNSNLCAVLAVAATCVLPEKAQGSGRSQRKRTHHLHACEASVLDFSSRFVAGRTCAVFRLPRRL